MGLHLPLTVAWITRKREPMTSIYNSKMMHYHTAPNSWSNDPRNRLLHLIRTPFFLANHYDVESTSSIVTPHTRDLPGSLDVPVRTEMMANYTASH